MSNLKGKFSNKVDISGSYKETFRKIEDLIKRDQEFEDQNLNISYSEEFKIDFERFFKEFEEENGFLRGKLEEMQEKMKDSKEILEKYKANFERIKEKLEESKDEMVGINEENEALKRQIEALERKSENQGEIIEILKLRIKGFEEEIEIEEGEIEGNEIKENGMSMESEENNGLEKEIKDLDHEIKYIQGILNNKL